MKVTQSCLTLWQPVDCSLPGSSVHGILQTIILEWVAIPFRGSSQPQDWTQVYPIAGGFFTLWATREAQMKSYGWALIWHNSCPYKKKEYWGTSTEEQPGEDTAGAQPSASPGETRRRPYPTSTLTSGFWPPGQWEHTFLLFETTQSWCFVKAAWEDSYMRQKNTTKNVSLRNYLDLPVEKS